MTERGDEIKQRDIDLDAIDDDVVMILSTARLRGAGIQRLPDRVDQDRPVAALQVETAEQAARVMSALDRAGRHLYLDVERKHDLDLMGIAAETVRHAQVSTTKPNDTTVGALMATLAHHRGTDHRDRRVCIVGAGNLGFKFALRLAEEGADVALSGRSAIKAQQLAGTINAIVPRYTPYAVRDQPHEDSIDVLVGAAAAAGVLTEEWLDRLAPHALCIDVGIGTLTPDLVEGAHAQGHEVCRLDVRAADEPLPSYPSRFFETTWGRENAGDHHLVAGGVLGRLGDVVLDRLPDPTAVLGVADGRGGLVPAPSVTPAMEARVEQAARRLVAVEPRSAARDSIA